MEIRCFANRMQDNEIPPKRQQREHRVDNACYNVCDENLFCSVEVDIQKETGFLCFVHEEERRKRWQNVKLSQTRLKCR